MRAQDPYGVLDLEALCPAVHVADGAAVDGGRVQVAAEQQFGGVAELLVEP